MELRCVVKDGSCARPIIKCVYFDAILAWAQEKHLAFHCSGQPDAEPLLRSLIGINLAVRASHCAPDRRLPWPTGREQCVLVFSTIKVF
jgi:hypothetical protein